MEQRPLLKRLMLTSIRNLSRGGTDHALALIVLSVEPSLLYLIGDPEDLIKVWTDQFQKKTWANSWNLDESSTHCG